MKITIHNQTEKDYKEIKVLLKKVFKIIEQDKTMQIVLVDKEEIRRLNSFYRQMDKITDVLSFESDEVESLGDIFICLDKAIEQAIEYNHSFDREVAFLAVHGYLHLIGYDHLDEESETTMASKQESILEIVGLRREK